MKSNTCCAALLVIHHVFGLSIQPGEPMHVICDDHVQTIYADSASMLAFTISDCDSMVLIQPPVVSGVLDPPIDTGPPKPRRAFGCAR